MGCRPLLSCPPAFRSVLPFLPMNENAPAPTFCTLESAAARTREQCSWPLSRVRPRDEQAVGLRHDGGDVARIGH